MSAEEFAGTLFIIALCYLGFAVTLWIQNRNGN